MLNRRGQRVYLHYLENKQGAILYYFSREAAEALTQLPEDREISFVRNGIPVLRRIRHYMPEME